MLILSFLTCSVARSNTHVLKGRCSFRRKASFGTHSNKGESLFFESGLFLKIMAPLSMPLLTIINLIRDVYMFILLFAPIPTRFDLGHCPSFGSVLPSSLSTTHVCGNHGNREVCIYLITFVRDDIILSCIPITLPLSKHFSIHRHVCLMHLRSAYEPHPNGSLTMRHLRSDVIKICHRVILNFRCYYISITIVQSYTGKNHEFVAVCIVMSAQHK